MMSEDKKNIILLFGVCPLPVEKSGISIGTGGRTWQFAKPLIAAGYKVIAICQSEINIPPGKPFLKSEPAANLQIIRLAENNYRNPGDIINALGDIPFDKIRCIIGAGSLLPNQMAGRLRKHLANKILIPFHADLYGDPIAEIQSKIEGERTPQKDSELFHIWKIVSEILLNLDHLSVVSCPQKYYALGQLSIAGRINSLTNGYEFADVIPCGVDVNEILKQKQIISRANYDKKSLRKKHQIPEDAFLIYWSGSFNSWMDAETFFKGIENAIAKDNAIHLLVTGGGIKGYCEWNYDNFVQNVGCSKFKDNFHLKGWTNEEIIPECFLIADLGINVDRKTYEGVFGSRNRILHFSSLEIPVLSTLLTELSEEMSSNNLISKFDIGDPDSFCEAILRCRQSQSDIAAMAKDASNYVMEHFSFEKTVDSLLKWVKKPVISPDINRLFNELGKTGFVSYTAEIISSATNSDNSTNGNNPDLKKISIIKKIKNCLAK